MTSLVIKWLADNVYGAPSRFAGGLLPNLLGYHALRVLFLNLVFNSRRRKVLKDEEGGIIVQQILNDGIAVIPDFFTEDIFLKIKQECEQLKIGVVNERAPHIKRGDFVNENSKNPNPVLYEHFANNNFINQIVSAVTGKKILFLPKVQVEISSFHENDIGKPTTDVKSDNLHFDVSYPTIKCFFYLNDIDERNAAFRYVRGSHKMTLQRLWMEYKMSVAFFGLWNKNRRDSETPEVSHKFVEQQGMKVVPITGNANTLVIVNTMGFHSRGPYLTATPRCLVLMTYRALESLSFLKKEFFSRSHR